MRAKVPPATCFPHNTNAKRILRRSDTVSTRTQEGKISRKEKKKSLFVKFRSSALDRMSKTAERRPRITCWGRSTSSRVGLAPGG